MKLGNRGTLIGDKDREAVTEYVGLAYARGHLTLDEMQERLDIASKARYGYQLAVARRDLPENIEPLNAPETAYDEEGGCDQSGGGLAALISFVLLVFVATLFIAGGLFTSHRTPPPQEQNWQFQNAQQLPPLHHKGCRIMYVGSAWMLICKARP